MPEIIEVRNYADLISKYLKSLSIIDIKILSGRYKNHGPFPQYTDIKNNLPLKLLDVKTKGKLLYMIFTNNFYILSTLGLTGGWCYLPESKQKMLFSKNIDDYSKYLSDTKINAYLQRSLKHLNVEFKTINGSIYYFDTLSFGTLKCVTNVDELNKILSKIGPDIMDVSTTIAIFIERIKQNKNINKCIGVVLMNQKVISGIGNYLRSDILYISQIDPFRTVGSLDDSEIKEIFSNCKILTWGSYNIKKGIELKIIKKNTKLPADYNRLFFIYNQKLDMYGNDIIKKELYEGSKKRFIYYVPNIQK